MARQRQKVDMENVSLMPTDIKKPNIAPGAWRADQINKSHSQANLPMRKIEVRSQGSQESIRERNQEFDSVGEYN